MSPQQKETETEAKNLQEAPTNEKALALYRTFTHEVPEHLLDGYHTLGETLDMLAEPMGNLFNLPHDVLQRLDLDFEDDGLTDAIYQLEQIKEYCIDGYKPFNYEDNFTLHEKFEAEEKAEKLKKKKAEARAKARAKKKAN